MDKNHKKNDFLAYINKPMSKESIAMLYDANNIRFEKCELYSDFVQSLLHLIFDTYLGDSVTCPKEQINHFKWCWDTNVMRFIEEGLVFENERLYNYFLEFMLEVFYTSPEKNNITDVDKLLLNLWINIFDFSKIKTHSDMDTLIEIYQLMEISLKIK